jgi:23S rRNA (uracil-5-)-methyltransferase RumA
MALTLPEELPRTASPRCSHFGECGGCALQDVPYEEQVKAKETALRELLGRDIEVVPAPDSYGYRHRMDYIVAFGKVGLRKKGDGKTVIDLDECPIAPERVGNVMVQAKAWIDELDVRGYNIVTNRGDLRYLTFRHAYGTDQLMVIAVTASEESSVEPLLEKLQAVADSVVWSIQPRTGDTSVGEVHRIYGRETIEASIRGRVFEISPNAFFQNNLMLVDALFEKVAEHVRGFTLDLFCGMGAIGLSVSDKIDKLVGVEVFEENIRLAKRAAERNGIEAEFIHDNANHFLAFYEGEVPDAVVIDPPRSGLAPKLIRKLNRLGARRIVYVSCNPKTFKMDLEQFEGYEWVDALGYDMFPQTPHVEMVNLLERTG